MAKKYRFCKSGLTTIVANAGGIVGLSDVGTTPVNFSAIECEIYATNISLTNHTADLYMYACAQTTQHLEGDKTLFSVSFKCDDYSNGNEYSNKLALFYYDGTSGDHVSSYYLNILNSQVFKLNFKNIGSNGVNVYKGEKTTKIASSVPWPDNNLFGYLNGRITIRFQDHNNMALTGYWFTENSTTLSNGITNTANSVNPQKHYEPTHDIYIYDGSSKVKNIYDPYIRTSNGWEKFAPYEPNIFKERF